MGGERARPVVLDTGALIAFERNDRRVRTLIELAIAHRAALHVPAGVVAQNADAIGRVANAVRSAQASACAGRGG